MTALKIEQVSIADLKLDSDNARQHSKKNLEAIAASLNEFGQRRPVVLYGSTVIAGNGTVQAATALGWESITVTRVPDDWSEDRAKAYAIADNRTAELADWDGEKLLETVSQLDPDLLAATGFSADELHDMQQLWGGAPDLDDLFDKIGEPTDEDGMTRVSFMVPPEVAAHWEMAVKQAGSGSYLENICTAVQAAYDAIVGE